MDLYVDDFFKKLHGDPYLSHRFLVEISGVFSASFSQFSGIKMQVQTIQARSGNDGRGVQQYVPVLTAFSPVTLSRGVIGSNDFLKWLASAADEETDDKPKGKDQEGNFVHANAIIGNSHGNIVISKDDTKLVVVKGLDNFMLVDSDNALMVCPRQDEAVNERLVDLTALDKGEYI